MMRMTVTVLTMLLTLGASAFDSEVAFEDPDMQARYERLIAEVRCVTCQNQNIKDSNAFIAADLRREIRRLMTEGKSDSEIITFLVDRYGDFVLYRPRFDGKTALLWLAPGILILLGAFGFYRVIRYRMVLPIEDEHSEESVAK